MVWLIAGLRYCLQAVVMGLVGRVIGLFTDKLMSEAPDILGVGKYHVHFEMDTPEGRVEKSARLPFAWMARFWVRVQYKRHAHKPEPRVVYKTKHATVTC